MTNRLGRYRGCLLGGAVGDALGYPVEFLGEGSIRAQYGPAGIRTLEQAGSPARISDDTQMTLFAANAIVYAKEHERPLAGCLWLAYREWLGTQGDIRRMDDPEHPVMWVGRDRRMHARRAPGNTCLSAIRSSPEGGTASAPLNGSKGCGTVMRAAPFGLAAGGLAGASRTAERDAALTHGHRMAWRSSGLLAQIVCDVVHCRPGRDYALQDVLADLDYSGDAAMQALLGQAAALAMDGSVTDLDGIHRLGEGWVAEEALAIAVFCAVRHQDDFAAAVRAAVNHRGDSDSTGAICGNILGAWLGEKAVADAFDLNCLELRDVIETMAGQLCGAAEGGAALSD